MDTCPVCNNKLKNDMKFDFDEHFDDKTWKRKVQYTWDFTCKECGFCYECTGNDDDGYTILLNYFSNNDFISVLNTSDFPKEADSYVIAGYPRTLTRDDLKVLGIKVPHLTMLVIWDDIHIDFEMEDVLLFSNLQSVFLPSKYTDEEHEAFASQTGIYIDYTRRDTNEEW